MRVYKKLHPNIPISQYPNIFYIGIQLSQYPNIPISQYTLYWDIGILGDWDIGILGYRDIGIFQYPNIPISQYNGAGRSCRQHLQTHTRPHQHTCQAGVLLLGSRPILSTAQHVLLVMCFRAPGHQNTCQAERVVRWTVWADGPSNKRPAWHVFWCGATASRATERPGTAKTAS